MPRPLRASRRRAATSPTRTTTASPRQVARAASPLIASQCPNTVNGQSLDTSRSGYATPNYSQSQLRLLKCSYSNSVTCYFDRTGAADIDSGVSAYSSTACSVRCLSRPMLTPPGLHGRPDDRLDPVLPSRPRDVSVISPACDPPSSRSIRYTLICLTLLIRHSLSVRRLSVFPYESIPASPRCPRSLVRR